jgi:hypothetical protein
MHGVGQASNEPRRMSTGTATLARMQRAASCAIAAAAMLAAPAVRAAEPDKPDAVWAGVVGAATAFAGFAIGGTIMGVTGDNSPVAMAGWLTMESGFALAPFTAHAVVGEWWRGVAFAALPTATTLSTIPVFAYNEGAVVHGSLPQQRWMYVLLCTGILSSGVGVVDAVLAPIRRRGRPALQVAPAVGAGNYGFVVGGAL